MSYDALTSTGGSLRRLVARAVGTLALGVAGLALGVVLAAHAVAAPSSAVDQRPLSSSVSAAVEVTTETVRKATEPLGTVMDAVGSGDAGIRVPNGGEPSPRPPADPKSEVPEQTLPGVDPDPASLRHIDAKPVTRSAAPVAPVAKATEPVREVVTRPAGESVTLVGQIVSPLEPTIRSVTEPLAPSTGGPLAPVVDVVSPVTDLVGGVAIPIVGASAHAPDPARDVVALSGAPALVVERLAPVPGLRLPGLFLAAEPVAEHPTYPGVSQAPDDIIDPVVRTSTGAQRALLDPLPTSSSGIATAVDTVRTLSVGTADVVRQDGPRLGPDAPHTAGGVGNPVVVAGSSLGAGVPQLKLLGGELLAALSALLIFRARAWRAATDESRARLSSIYTDVPVSPA